MCILQKVAEDSNCMKKMKFVRGDGRAVSQTLIFNECNIKRIVFTQSIFIT